MTPDPAEGSSMNDRPFCAEHTTLIRSVAGMEAETKAQTAILMEFKEEARKAVAASFDRILAHENAGGHSVSLDRIRGIAEEQQRLREQHEAHLAAVREIRDTANTNKAAVVQLQADVEPVQDLVLARASDTKWTRIWGIIIVTAVALVQTLIAWGTGRCDPLSAITTVMGGK